MTHKKLSLLLPFLLAGAAAQLWATNGDQMIATGTKSMGMGGVSVASQ
jgi:hypothetical protein